MNGLRLITLFSLFAFSLESGAVAGSITDPALSSTESSVSSSQSLRGSIKTRITRNIRISADSFARADRQNGLFDTLFTKEDLNLSYPLALALPLVENSSFFDDVDAFFVLGYQRPLYATDLEIKEYCWSSYICFNDINLGVSKPVIQAGRFSAGSSVYLSLPFSRSSFKQSFLTGVGASLNTSYSLLSNSYFNLSTISTHSLDLNFYIYEMANVNGTAYNIPFTTFNQLGFQFQYLKSAFIPALFFYSSHNFAVNYNSTPFHSVSLNMSAAWSINKKIKIVAGLNWGDRVLKPKDSSLAVDTVVFNADQTYLSFAASYSF